MNRIVERFAQLKHDGKKGFVVYIGAGDPNLEATRKLALAFDQAGVDVLELGVPFSDPLADGLVNQLAAQRGLESGTTPPKLLETIAAIRKDSQIPIVLYIYFNLIHKVGMEKFINDCAKAGVDGLLVLDLPPEESDNYEALMKKSGLCHIYLVAPTTPEERMEFIVKRGSGFIYYISREGVTGMQTKWPSNRTFQEFISDCTGHDIYDQKYSAKGESKANRLRSFWQSEPNHLVGKVLNEMIDYCKANKSALPEFEECRRIAQRLLLDASV